MKKNAKNKFAILTTIFFILIVTSFVVRASIKHAVAQESANETESTALQTIRGIIRPLIAPGSTCEKNKVNETKLCEYLESPGNPRFIGGSDKINNKIQRNVGKKVEVSGFWVNVTGPRYFVAKSLTVLTQPTPTDIPPVYPTPKP